MWRGLAPCDQHIKFFRFRTPVSENGYLGVRNEEIVCIPDAIKLIDYPMEDFIQENMLMMNMSKGGLTYSDLCSLPFDVHQRYCKISADLQEELKKNNPGEV